MHKTIVLFLAFFSLNTSAQVGDSKTTKKWWVGINAADLIVNDAFLQPALCADWNISGKHHLRLQVGYDSRSSTSDYNSSMLLPNNNRVTDSTSQNNPFDSKTIGARLGYYHSKKINPKVDVFFGADAVYQKSQATYSTHFDIIQDFGGSNKTFISLDEKGDLNSESFGVSPFAGIQWHLSEGVRISFESQVLFVVQNIENKLSTFSRQTSSFNPNEFIQDTNRLEASQGNITKLLPLSGLYLYIQI